MRLPYALAAPLRTDRLVLRTMTEADVDDIHAYQSLPDVCAYVTYEPRSRAEVAEKVAQYSQATTLAGEGDYWQLAVERAEEPGRVIGDVYFTIRSEANETAEIGWVLNPDFSGRGYMTEAARAVLGIAFDEIGVHRVAAVLDPRNTTSIALCERLGMRREAHFVEDLWFKGAWGDTLIYGLLAREWAATPPR